MLQKVPVEAVNRQSYLLVSTNLQLLNDNSVVTGRLSFFTPMVFPHPPLDGGLGANTRFSSDLAAESTALQDWLLLAGASYT